MEVPGEIAYRHVVLRTVAAVCKVAIKHVCGRGVSASGFTHQVVSAVGEAFNNIVAHCYRDRAADIVRIAMAVENDRLLVTLEDYGASFDPLRARLPDLGSLPESGLGIFIMRSMIGRLARLAWDMIRFVSLWAITSPSLFTMNVSVIPFLANALSMRLSFM